MRFYWFELEPSNSRKPAAAAAPAADRVTIPVAASKLGFLHSQAREAVEPALQAYLQANALGRRSARRNQIGSFFRFCPADQKAATPTFVSLIDADYVDGTSRTSACQLPSCPKSDSRSCATAADAGPLAADGQR